MIKVRITVEPKKNCKQDTIWGIRQIAPRPDFEGVCGSFRWRNMGDLAPQWRPTDMEKPSIGQTYVCDLLRSDTDKHDFDSRRSHAGYVENCETGVENPGAIVLRGVSLGEMSIWFEGNPSWPQIHVRGYVTSPTDGERKFVRESIVPHLLTAIGENRATLKADAIRELRLYIADKVKTAQKRLDKLETEMLLAIEEAAQ